MLEAKKGHIIGIASMASYFTCAGLTDYCATKHGVLALHEGMPLRDDRCAPSFSVANQANRRIGLNQELKHRYGPNGRCIQTSIVHPNWAQTPLVAGWDSSLIASKTYVLPPSEVSDRIVEQVFSGRSGQVFVPGRLAVFSGIKGFPAWLQEHARDGLHLATKPT